MTPEVKQYIGSFDDNQRQVILKAIIDSELLAEAFESEHGKLILNNAVDLITNNILQIVRYCSDNPPQEAQKMVYPHAMEVNTVYKLMKDWALILIRGDEYKKRAERK